jgi:outer membrane receptor protein involved in Fe transport
MAYITIARGHKPGGVNTSASANQPWMSPNFQDFTQDNLSFDSEVLLNKEIGLKTLLLDHRLSINAALFHSDRKNAQLENWMWDDMAGLWIGYLDSTSDASNYGAELETRFDINHTLQLFVSLAWLETNVDSIATFDQDQWDFVTKTNREQTKAANYQYNVGAKVMVTASLSGHIELEGQDDSYYGYYHDGKIDSYSVVNASLNWSNDALTINLWGRNLTDKAYASHGIYTAADPRDNYGAWSNTSYQQFGEPRSYGVNISYAL